MNSALEARHSVNAFREKLSTWAKLDHGGEAAMGVKVAADWASGDYKLPYGGFEQLAFLLRSKVWEDFLLADTASDGRRGPCRPEHTLWSRFCWILMPSKRQEDMNDLLEQLLGEEIASDDDLHMRLLDSPVFIDALARRLVEFFERCKPNNRYAN